MSRRAPDPSWVVLNQSLSPAFQEMLERLADRFGPGLLYTGTPSPSSTPALRVEAAPAYDRASVRGRLVTWSRYAAAAAARMARLRGRPFVLAVTNPPFLPHVVGLAARVRRWPYAVLVWDIYPDHVVHQGLLGPGHPAVRAWTAANRLALRGAALTLTLGPRMADTLRDHLGPDAARARLEVVPNWADTDFIRPRPKEDNAFAREHGQVGVTTVLYSGNVGASHGLEVLIEAAERLRDDPRVAFLVVGDGLGRPPLEAAVAAKGLANVRFADRQPWERVPEVMAAGDLCVVSQAAGSEHLSVPSKTYSYLAAGAALLAITAPGGDLDALVEGEGVGVVSPSGDPDALAARLRAVLDDPEGLAAMRRRAREAAEARYSAEAVFERLSALLGPLIAGAGR